MDTSSNWFNAIEPSWHAYRPSGRTDVTNYSALEKTFAEVVEDFHRIDGL